MGMNSFSGSGKKKPDDHYRSRRGAQGKGYEDGDLPFERESLPSGDIVDIYPDQIRSRFTSLSPQDLRAAPRVSASWEVIVLGPGRSVRCEMENVSEVGCLLNLHLPREFNHNVLEVILVHKMTGQPKPQYFLFHARTIDLTTPSRRLKFIKAVGDSLQRLSSALNTLRAQTI